MIKDVDNLIFDGNNMCNIHYYGNKDAPEDEYIGLTFQNMIFDMKNIFEELKPNKIIIAFDNSSWRKLYTNDLSQCVTHQKYKGRRNLNKTPKEIAKRNLMMEKLNDFSDFLKEYSSLIVLSGKYLEADDLIAGYVQEHPEETHVIVSSDKDFMQLIDDNVKLYNPVSDSYRDLSEYDNDAEYYLFEKCFRGDNSSDNIMSSYPRIRKSKIKEAYKDDFLFNNLMNHEFNVESINGEGELITHSYLTKDLFDENKYLICLKSQPEVIREKMKKVIKDAIENRKKMSMFHFLKFCGKYDLPLIISNANSFIELLNR